MSETSQSTPKGQAMARVTIEIVPGEDCTTIKEFRRVMEFPVSSADLPLRISAESARKAARNVVLAEEMCED